MTSDIGGFELKEEFSAKWLRIFHHNSTDALYFKSFDEATFSLNPQKYSIFKLLPRIRIFDVRIICEFVFSKQFKKSRPKFNTLFNFT